MNDDTTFDEWMEFGVRQGWATAPVCYVHDGLPMTDQEEQDFFDDEPCIHIVRLCETKEQQQAIEHDHSPSAWRRSNRNW